MQFPWVFVAVLLACTTGNDSFSTGDDRIAHVAVDSAASGHFVRRDNSMPLEDVQSLAQLAYLPPEKRNETGLKAWYAHLGKVTSGLSEDIAKHLPSDASCLVLDIGANVGSFIDDVRAKRSECKIIAFEPVQEIYSFNLDHHPATAKLTLENIALSDTSGPQIIYRARSSDLGENSFQRKSHDVKPEKVDCTTMDKYAKANKLMNTSINAINIDVSGSEWRVLRGMHAFLQSLDPKPVIAMKIDPNSVGSLEWKQEVTEIEWLFANGYQRNNYTSMKTEEIIFLPHSVLLMSENGIVGLGTPLAWAMMRVWSGVLSITAFLVVAIYCMAVSHKRR